jgi:serine/threonine protein kinase
MTSTAPSEVHPLFAHLDGQFSFQKELGRGGMGVVYPARDEKLERLAAIKVLPPELTGNEDVRARFLREARIAGQLSHPNIVPIYRADEIEGNAFFVMAARS